MLVRLFLVFAVVINILCKDGEDVEDMEVSGSEASEGLCPESTSNSDCGECCGGHAPHPTLSMSPRSPNIIPGTHCCFFTIMNMKQGHLLILLSRLFSYL